MSTIDTTINKCKAVKPKEMLLIVYLCFSVQYSFIVNVVEIFRCVTLLVLNKSLYDVSTEL